MREIAAVLTIAIVLSASCDLPVPRALPLLAGEVLAQAPDDRAIRDLASPDAGRRLRAVRALKAEGGPEAASLLAPAILDPQDEVQAEAIQAELNIFRATRVVPRRRVALIVEVRSRLGAEAAFADGPWALGAGVVPADVLAALLGATRDDHPRVAVEALYAFGTLAGDAAGAGRASLLRDAGPALAGMLGVPVVEIRVAAARVIGRLFARPLADAPVEQAVGDAVVTALNDREDRVRLAAIDALGAMRYERGVQALVDLHQYYRRSEVGLASLQALSRIGHASSVPLFQAALSGSSAAGKVAAAEGLARVGGAGRSEEIGAALARERNGRVRLARRFADVLLSGAALDPLFDALTKPDLRDQALDYLLEIAPGRAGDFEPGAKHPVARVRADVARLLGVARDPAALPLVEALTRDADADVAGAAARAAARLRRLP